jgi:hypothetical protein
MEDDVTEEEQGSWLIDVQIFTTCNLACPCHHGMKHRQVADGGTVSRYGW